ncbi:MULTISPECIES: carboxylesterase/lipase family protein [Mycobacteriaceae]|uniref:Carboxylic ester hydrolase n=2 Tax=Mycobacteriaceae TaxID=1762 RepID=A0A2A2ZAN1_MYCAV|nr:MULTISPECIES: carboxylesterase/lipase family protein [Mycobacteriaceae]MCQ4363456.1 carboxylesterase/lipase family protein [Mycobacterium gordonae]MDX1880977.1 carboxylesterase/lipase family protein [Mycolicibacterium sp. 141076]PBA23468.1 carboxylesterase/lipase family protein [Mycobacterium avium]RIT45924.1 carboxylesterase/lipase family protein [Mycobacteroides abscessus]SKT73623.1 carboxylesterase, LipT [Mycobacteroides abscessus subsp. massiliense]
MAKSTVTTTITSGTVEGFTEAGVHRWRSIPYGRPPIGLLRWRAPQPAESWLGIRECHEFRHCAYQERKYTMVGLGRYQSMSEDCLTLNVTAPEGSGDQPLPVMVFIHGGAYMLGSSATPLYDGAALARQGCVFVSVNYRLGALGCLDLSSLSTADITIEDNLYLRDVVLALTWVRDNIAKFGGDPGNVTIFGESAGAHTVATLLAVPAARGLFARAISESPASVLSRTPAVAAEFASRYAETLGLRVTGAAPALMDAGPDQLVAAQLSLTDQTTELGAFPFGPTYGTDFLPVEPVEAMRSGIASRVPLIVGTNAEEGKLFDRLVKLVPLNPNSIEQLLSDIEPGHKERITAAYPGYPNPAACVQLGGDLVFGSAAWQIAEAHSNHAPTFLYQFDYAPRVLRWTGLGATHATELFAVFDAYRSPVGKLLTAGADRSAALRVSDEMQRRWLAFSQSGVPGHDWPHYRADERAVMVFDRESRIDHNPHAVRRQAWDGFSLGLPTAG